MPDDYPRDAWSTESTAANIATWESMLASYDLDTGPARNPKGRAFASLLRKRAAKSKSFEEMAELTPMEYEGVIIDERIEYINRKQMVEMLRLASDEDVLEIVKCHLHFGNRKVPECYLIWNLNPAHMCPSLRDSRGKVFDYRTEKAPDPGRSLCQAFTQDGKLVCYAWAAELGYKDCFPYRVRQNELWDSVIRDNPDVMVQAVEDLHAEALESNQPIVAFRWSEAGDLEDQKSLDVACEISNALRRLPVPEYITTQLYDDHEIPGTGRQDAKGKWIKGTGTIVKAGLKRKRWQPGAFTSYLYSARSDLDFRKAPKSGLVVLGSDWTGPGLSGQFVMVEHPSDDPQPDGENWRMCPMKCRICQRCPSGLSSRVLAH